MHRLFIALDFPNDTTDHLANICHGISGARWTPQEQLHLTLRFIGDVDDTGLRDIEDALEEVRSAPLELQLRGVGYFPPRKAPRVLWVGVVPTDELRRLHASIESALERVGFEREHRKFHPHITIARLGDYVTGHDIAPFLSANNLFSSGTMEVNEFHLYSSILKPSGAIHRIEATYELDDYLV